MPPIIILISTLLLIIPSSITQDVKYCDPNLCNGQSNIHIGCPGVLVSSCPADAQLLNIATFKDYIVRRHNENRNLLAAGQFNLPRAVRLAEVIWDDELAYLATLNARQCKMAHDRCRNTKEYPWSGQNIAWTWGYPSDSASIDYALNSWWGEYKDTTAQDIAKYKTSTAVIGHFTVMANQKSIRVGCGGISYDNGKERVFVCNYSFTNAIGTAVYKTGNTGGECTTGRSLLYPNLCSKNEPIDYKSFW